jgi:hypothetical protein
MKMLFKKIVRIIKKGGTDLPGLVNMVKYVVKILPNIEEIKF